MMTTDGIPFWILTFPFILWVIGVYIASFIIWRKNRRITAQATPICRQRFTDLKISSTTYAHSRAKMGFTVTGQVLLLDDHIVITSQKMSLKLFQTTLPVVLENKKGLIKKVVMTSWKTVQITCIKNTVSFGRATVEVIIETKDTDVQIAIFDHIKHWN